jgi:GNAT superfamily N-acetyltransferase
MIRRAVTREDFAAAAGLMQEYIDWLPFELDFQDFESELADVAAHYSAPGAAVFLASGERDALGVVGVRSLGDGVAEMKRMYVNEAARGNGLGRRLAVQAIEFAREQGYVAIRLDSDLESMPVANRLYDELGFVDIPQYRDNPLRCSRFMELQLQSPWT